MVRPPQTSGTPRASQARQRYFLSLTAACIVGHPGQHGPVYGLDCRLGHLRRSGSESAEMLTSSRRLTVGRHGWSVWVCRGDVQGCTTAARCPSRRRDRCTRCRPRMCRGRRRRAQRRAGSGTRSGRDASRTRARKHSSSSERLTRGLTEPTSPATRRSRAVISSRQPRCARVSQLPSRATRACPCLRPCPRRHLRPLSPPAFCPPDTSLPPVTRSPCPDPPYLRCAPLTCSSLLVLTREWDQVGGTLFAPDLVPRPTPSSIRAGQRGAAQAPARAPVPRCHPRPPGTPHGPLDDPPVTTTVTSTRSPVRLR